MNIERDLAQRIASWRRGEPVAPMDDETWHAYGEYLARQVDQTLAALAEIPDPAPGFATRKARDQERYDRQLAELETWREVRESWLNVEHTLLDRALDQSAMRADLAAQAFVQELESINV